MSGQNQVGLCHGVLATQLPTPQWIVDSCQKKQISRMMLMLSDEDTENSTIIDLLRCCPPQFEVVLCVPNSLINSLADLEHAKTWVRKYVYEGIVTCVCVGDLSTLATNGDPSQKFSSALFNIRAIVPKATMVSTMVDVSMLVNSGDNTPYSGNTTAPSYCKFQDENRMKDLVIPFLKAYSYPLFARIFPYFQINRRPNRNLPEDSNYLINDDARNYLEDPVGNFSYRYVYDAMLDSIYCAMNEAGSQDKVPVYVVTGWPTRGSILQANRQNQVRYIENVRRHEGTPMRPRTPIVNYFYCLVNQDQDDRPRQGVVRDEWKYFGIVSYP